MEQYMKRALEISKRGLGKTSPNPIVGAVIVKNGAVIGEGWHEKYGGCHAEINAFKNSTEDVEGATLYVTLEPCSHYGNTPPCAYEIVKKKIKSVVIGMRDPNPIVSGKGIEILKNASIDVIYGVLEKECKLTNEVFTKYITQKNPFVVMKTAMTLDGKIATTTGDSKWVSCEQSRKYVKNLRSTLTGIMVGINTIIQDNPKLTTRLKGMKNPVRIIVDSNLNIDLNAHVLKIEKGDRCIIGTTENADKYKLEKLTEMGAEVIVTKSMRRLVDLKELMSTLGTMNIDSVLLEGGGSLNYSAIQSGIVDKVITFISPKIVGGVNSKTPVEGEGIQNMNEAINIKNMFMETVGEDIMVVGYL